MCIYLHTYIHTQVGIFVSRDALWGLNYLHCEGYTDRAITLDGRPVVVFEAAEGMYVCICVYVCMMYVCVYVCMNKICICLCLCVYMYVCMYVCIRDVCI